MNIDMLVFGEDWGQHPSSTQHLIKHFLNEQEIVWVNSLGLRKPRLDARDVKRALSKLRAFMNTNDKQINGGHTHLRLINPITIPLPDNPLARRFNEYLLTKKLSPFVKSSMKKPILWTSLPSAVDVVGKLNESAAVYYCGDDFSALDGVDHQPVASMEQELADKCQLIITASEQLALKFAPEKTVVVPHGVDLDLFSIPKPRAKDLPNGPVAGFYGAIAGWFDQQLMIETAKQLPHWSFVLIGPATTDISELLLQPNIQWLGPKPHSVLASYSQHWDVGILPFKRNGQIQACNPLKLREYLAAGSAIVSTDFPALDGYRDLVKVSNDVYGFANSIQQCVDSNEQKLHMINKRQQRVENESWSQRAKEVSELLHNL